MDSNEVYTSAQMYDNGNEFLRNEIDESQLKMKKKFEEGDDYTVRWWKKKLFVDMRNFTMKVVSNPKHFITWTSLGCHGKTQKQNI